VAELYRYDTQNDKTGEEPIDEYDHPLDALRYLVLAIDSRKLARWTGWFRRNDEAAPPPPPVEPKPKRKWLSIHNEALSTPMVTVLRGDWVDSAFQFKLPDWQLDEELTRELDRGSLLDMPESKSPACPASARRT
jgi:hypothetical protein